jgi:DNA polymerase-3 subunit alpha
VVEAARSLEDLRASGAVGIALRWRSTAAPTTEALRAATALCEAHPGPAPVYIEWSDGNGEALRLRARRLRVDPDDELMRALRTQLGPESVLFVKVG